MASITSEGFAKSLEKFRNRLSAEQRQQFSLSSLDDVKLEMQQLQDRLGPEKKLRSFNRIKKFLDGMKQVEQLVQIFLNVHEVVAFVWGPIKLALMVASTRIDTLENLLDAYQEIGEVLHGVGKYDRLFKNYPDIQRILEMYFYDVLEFHHEVLRVFGRPDWRRFLDYAWPTFKSKFEPIVYSLKRHRDLLSDEKLTVVLEEVEESRDAIETMSITLLEINNKLDKLKEDTTQKKRERDELIKKQKETVKTKLCPPNYKEDHRLALKKRTSISSGDWVLEDSRFKAWLCGDTAADSVLYLNGIPGSGKTTLMSRIVDYLSTWGCSNDCTVLFFYFKDASEVGRSRNGMFRALLQQLLDQDDTLLEYLYQKCVGLTNSEAVYEPFLEELVKYCFASRGKIRIVLDALDECEQADELGTHPVITWFQEVLSTTPLSFHIRFLVSGQRDGCIDSLLSNYPGIDLDKAQSHSDDIRNYASLRASSIKARFKLDSNDEADIIRNVTECSDGMFLFAKIVLDNLLYQESKAKFRTELARETFPRGLNQAYDRVVVRIFDQPSEERKASAFSILSWIISAGRPLRWREVQARFCIEPEDAICDSENRRVDSCKAICGSLVEVEPCDYYTDSKNEQTITIVHPTASCYLMETGRIRVFEEHAKAAIFFSQYLTSYPFNSTVPKDEIRQFALDGYYGLQDYACAFWGHHARLALSQPSNISSGMKSTIIQHITQLKDICQSKLHSGDSQGDDSAEDVAQDLETVVSRTLSRINEWHGLGAEGTPLSNRVISIRRVIEQIDDNALDESQHDVFLELHGVRRFKCPRTNCLFYATGFVGFGQRGDHVKEHERPFKCSTPGCYARIIGFPSSSALEAHIARLHSSDTKTSRLFPRPWEAKVLTIHKAAIKGDLETLKLLHSMGHSIVATERANSGRVPLALAAKHGHVGVCEYLMNQGLDPYYRSAAASISPMREAVKKGNYEVFEVLKNLSTYTTDAKELLRLFSFAVASGSTEIFDDIVKDVNLETIRTKPHTVWKNLPGDCRDFLNFGPASFGKQRLTIHKALAVQFPIFYEEDQATLKQTYPPEIDKRELKRVTHFLRRGAVLAGACDRSSYAVAECILDLTDLVAQSGTPLPPDETILWGLVDRFGERQHWASACLRDLTLRLALKVDVNLRDKHGNLPIHLAARKGNTASLGVLIPRTQNLDEENDDGMAAIEVAVRERNGEAAKLLLQSGRVDVNRKTKDGESLIRSSKTGQLYYAP
ncbi:hypothetical protein TWF281_011056 [Arthrobotrys megalospora]